MNNQKDSQEFRKLIEKYLEGKIKGDEIEKLVNYYESFQKSHDWVEGLGSENAIKDKMLTNILESIQEDPIAINSVPFYRKSIFKYAVAATIALLISINFISHKSNLNEVMPAVTYTKDISVGTDKATLTLADGTLVDLESGESYKSNHVNSNGKEIIYDNDETNQSEVAYNYLTIPRGGQFFVKLSDGTQVWLNSESQLKYPVNFVSGQTREVELVYGEAYFDVSPSSNHKDAKFTVITESQTINVIGTEFNVKAYRTENEIMTTLVEGKVEIMQEKNRLFLKPNQKSIIKKNSDVVDIQYVDVSYEIAWLKGLYMFEDTSLEEIMHTLSRWYDFEVDFKNAEKQNYVFTGILERSKSIQDILKNLEATGEIDFEINNNIITIN